MEKQKGAHAGWVERWLRPRRDTRPADGGRSHGSLRSLVGRVLRTADPCKLGRLLLADDPVFGRVPAQRRDEAVRYGLEVGAAIARELVAQHKTTNPFILARSLGVKVTYSDRAGRVGARVNYSEYGSKPPTIVIYQQSMDEVNGAIKQHGLELELGLGDITPLHAAHELYHHVEMHRKPSPTAGFRVTTLALGPLRLTSGLVSLSEIAANAFAQELLHLRVFPTALEYVTIYLHSPGLAWEMVERLQGMAVWPEDLAT